MEQIEGRRPEGDGDQERAVRAGSGRADPSRADPDGPARSAPVRLLATGGRAESSPRRYADRRTVPSLPWYHGGRPSSVLKGLISTTASPLARASPHDSQSAQVALGG